MLAAANAGQAVVASILGLGAAGVAGGVIAMAWSLHLHQIQLADRLARREASGLTEPADNVIPVQAMNGNGPKVAAGIKVAAGNGPPHSPDGGSRVPRAGEVPRPAPPPAIEGPDSVVIGQQARYRVHRSGTQQVVSWAAGGGAVSQAFDPAHPDDLLLVADRPGSLTVSVRLREGLAERRETKAVTAVADPEAAMPAIASRLLLQDWPVITIAVLVVGSAAALVAVGSLPVGDFIALVVPLTAVLAVVAATRGTGGRPGLCPWFTRRRRFPKGLVRRRGRIPARRACRSRRLPAAGPRGSPLACSRYGPRRGRAPRTRACGSARSA
jgi:hypothetical protein